MNIKVKKLYESVVLPEYKTSGAAAFDFESVIDIIINPNETKIIPTGLAFEIPDGYELQVRPRSGLSAKTKLRVSNSPGTIDSDYRGEVCIILDNISSEESYTINKGERIAQGVISKVEKITFEEVENLSETERGEAGFGSTGK